MPYVVPTDESGNVVSPQLAALPILHRTSHSTYRVIGTGFYLTRYGLVATASHVVQAMATGNQLDECYVLEDLGNGKTTLLRRITIAYINPTTDAAVMQTQFDTPRPNKFVKLSRQIPAAGSAVATYSYPANSEWNTGIKESLILKCDYYIGNFSALIDNEEARRRRERHEYFNQNLVPPFFETTLAIAGGASGSPVFNERGAVIGIYSSGFGCEPLSYVVPTSHLLDVQVTLPQLPDHIIEARIITRAGNGPHSVHTLAQEGHFQIE